MITINDNMSGYRDRVVEIQRITAHYFGIAQIHITGKRRDEKMVEPRHIAMYLAHKYTPLTLPVLGHLFLKDHSTVMHAVEKISVRMEVDAELQNHVKCVELQFNWPLVEERK